MSVPSGKRTVTKLKIFEDCQQLASYTVTVTSNIKKFPLQYNYFIQKIQDTALTIYHDAWIANSIKVVDADSFNERDKLQKSSILACRSLYCLIDTGITIFHIDTSRVDYWCGLIDNVLEQLTKWHQFDVNSYKEKISK